MVLKTVWCGKAWFSRLCSVTRRDSEDCVVWQGVILKTVWCGKAWFSRLCGCVVWQGVILKTVWCDKA